MLATQIRDEDRISRAELSNSICLSRELTGLIGNRLLTAPAS